MVKIDKKGWQRMKWQLTRILFFQKKTILNTLLYVSKYKKINTILFSCHFILFQPTFPLHIHHFVPFSPVCPKIKPYVTVGHEFSSCKKVLWTHCYIYLSKTIWIRPLSVVLSLSAKLFFLNLHHFVPFSPFCPKKKSLLRLETKGYPCKKLFRQ